MQQIILAAGKFETAQHYFDGLRGVLGATPGFTGGGTEDPTRAEVDRGGTGHAEAVLIEYDNDELTTEALIEHFLRLKDADRRFEPYRLAIFCVTDEQKEIAETILGKLPTEADEAKAVQLELAGPFYEVKE